jgi:hypothetical protein
MEEEVKTKFEEFDKRLELIGKRFDDFKTYIGGIGTLFGLGFGILTLILSWNYSNERTALRELEKDIKTELGKAESPPSIILLGPNGQLLTGQELTAKLQKDEQGIYFSFDYIIRNDGENTTGPLYIKNYTNDPLVENALSSDESSFKYESYVPPDKIDPNQLPGHYSVRQTANVTLDMKEFPPPGRNPVMIKVFYGKGKVQSSTFYVIIPKS